MSLSFACLARTQTVMARECGPPRWVLYAPGMTHAETRSRGGLFLLRDSAAPRDSFEKAEEVSPGWPAFAGHDTLLLGLGLSPESPAPPTLRDFPAIAASRDSTPPRGSYRECRPARSRRPCRPSPSSS